MISLIYFLLASCFLIGCFANFAGNGYGYSLAVLAANTYAVFLIPRGIYVAKKVWKKSRLLALRILAEHWLVVLGMLGIMLKLNHLFGAAAIMIAGFLPLSLTYFYQSVSAFFSWFRSGRQISQMLQLLILLFCSAEFYTTLSKFMNWPGSTIPFLAGFFLLILILATVFVRKEGQPDQPEAEAELSHSPVGSYFYILLVGNLHFFGSILGVLPGFQFPERPLTLGKILEEPASDNRNSRVNCYYHNIDCFFSRRTLDKIGPGIIKEEISSQNRQLDSLFTYCLP